MRYVILGGGVAGVACAEELCRGESPPRADAAEADDVVLVVAAPSVKRVTNRVRLGGGAGGGWGALLETFDVTEVPLAELERALVGSRTALRCMQGVCVAVDSALQLVTLLLPGPLPQPQQLQLHFDRLCVCAGSAPRERIEHPLVVSLRDSATVEALAQRLVGARRALVLGNGGIALGLAHEAPRIAPACQLVWAVRDSYLGTTFFDASASAFFLACRGQGEGQGPCIAVASTTTLALAHAPAPLVDDSLTLASSFRHVAKADPLPDAAAAPDLPKAAFVALPQRAPRGGRRKRERAGEGSTARSQAPAAAVNPSAAVTAFLSPAAASVPAPTLTPASAAEQRPFGSGVGPSWVQSLQHAFAAASSVHPGVACGIGGSEGGDRGVLLETCAELVALRGSGEGRVGALADGDWHSVGELRGVQSGLVGPTEGGDAARGFEAEAGTWPLQARLSNGREYFCDFIVSATGIVPVTNMVPLDGFTRHADGGLLVNELMQTTGSARVFAAGDSAAVLWPRAAALRANMRHGLGVLDPEARVPLWFQMRLWDQARTQGEYAARCMSGRRDALERGEGMGKEEGCGVDEDGDGDGGDGGDGGMAFELFAHATRFLGFRVVLLGLFNGQGLGSAYEQALRSQVVTATGLQRRGDGASSSAGAGGAPEADATTALLSSSSVQVQLRVTPGVEYAKVVLLHGRVVGALLIGDTDLEETLEHLMLNRLDVRRGEHGEALDLLDPDVDVEDFFD